MSGETPRPPNPAQERARRLFLALWPDASMREQLAHAVRKSVRGSDGRPVPQTHYHLTLAFIGAVPEGRVAELGALVRAVTDAGPIEVPLQELAYWPGPRVLCAVPRSPLAGLAGWAGRLLETLAAGSFAPDLKPFRPHVTVARKVLRPSASATLHPLLWRFDEFALIESRTLAAGPVYSVVQTYPLSRGTLAAK